MKLKAVWIKLGLMINFQLTKTIVILIQNGQIKIKFSLNQNFFLKVKIKVGLQVKIFHNLLIPSKTLQ